MAQALGRVVSIPWPAQTSDHHADIPTHSHRDAPVSPARTRYPVLIFSNGYAMITRTNTVLMEEPSESPVGPRAPVPPSLLGSRSAG
jgi:hypothetical protein